MRKKEMQKIVNECAKRLIEAGAAEVIIYTGNKNGTVFTERACPQFRLVVLARMAHAVAFDLCPPERG